MILSTKMLELFLMTLISLLIVNLMVQHIHFQVSQEKLCYQEKILLMEYSRGHLNLH